MTRKTRRRFSPEQRSAILRRHLVDKIAVSDLCDEYSIQPSLFYGWQKQLFDNIESALQDGRNGRAGAAERKIEALEEKLIAKDAEIARKESVIAEVAQEYVALKKTVGSQS